MKLKQNLEVIPYLDKAVIEGFADVSIKSNDGENHLVNKLLLISWGRIEGHQFQRALLDHHENNEDIIISSDFNSQDVNLFCDFVMKGLLPCSADEIIDGMISDNILRIFKLFGIDLEHIIGSTLISAKIEPIEKSVDEDLDFIENIPPSEETFSKPMIVYGPDDINAKKIYEKELFFKEQQFQCDLCQKNLSSKRNLKKHKTDIHGDGGGLIYQCEECGETFKTYDLRRYHHKKMHLEPPSLQCKMCPKTFGMAVN